MASETEHCGQKQIRCADDFCRGRTPTVCANVYTATDFCPDSSSRLQRRQYKCSKVTPGCQVREKSILSHPARAQVCRKIRTGNLRRQSENQVVLYPQADAIMHSATDESWSVTVTDPSLVGRPTSSVPLAPRRQKREQVAAVCFRVSSAGIEFLLVRTRKGRWTFPKGALEPELTRAQTAALEAFEEAGVHGRIEEAPFTRYRKRGDTEEAATGDIVVHAFLCEVLRLGPPQESNRNRTWFFPEEAKAQLSKDRARQYGAELARAVDRGVARIERLKTRECRRNRCTAKSGIRGSRP